ncbi:signal peptide peptidase SppA [Bhargavaea cecembensis]|uniref:Signal peptide peptidase SppA n=1 Tax=Bhargavaea cecembensis TaxID=394098 RepID=A0A163G6J0_9BACL|nr:signal peptide peptidase SppA [Bhargavaea cecembensis]KZE39806.1 signal peptide peptidase SppA [Bhargavaea cecembensis]
MNMKRWIALGAAILLFVVAAGINTVSSIMSMNWQSVMEDQLAPAGGQMEQVVEDGNARNRIALLRVDGIIQDTGAASPLFAPTGYNHQAFMEQLEMIREDKSVKGVVLYVNSPGGGVVESSDIHDKLVEIKEEKDIPVYVSMGAMAASGGYYISAPADKIFVHKETLTGSIGVIMESINYGGFAEEHGIDFVTIKSGEYKDILSPTREMTEEEREMLQTMLNDSYERFVDVIEAGRGMSEAEVKKWADGRIMNGGQAIDAKLADETGRLEDAIAGLRTDHGLEGAQMFEYSIDAGFGSLFGVKMQSLFQGDLESRIIGQVLSDYNSPRMMYLYGEK